MAKDKKGRFDTVYFGQLRPNGFVHHNFPDVYIQYIPDFSHINLKSDMSLTVVFTACCTHQVAKIKSDLTNLHFTIVMGGNVPYPKKETSLPMQSL